MHKGVVEVTVVVVVVAIIVVMVTVDATVVDGLVAPVPHVKEVLRLHLIKLYLIK